MIKLTAAEQAEAKWILKDLLKNASGRWNKTDAEAFYQFIVSRSFDFLQPITRFDSVDDLLRYFGKRLRSPRSGRSIPRPVDQIAKYVAYFCQMLGIIWDTSLKTQFEMNAYLDTVLGKALHEAGCLGGTPTPVGTTTPAASNMTSSATAAAKKPPVSGYKSSGPQSANVVGIVNQGAGKQSYAIDLFSIEADKLGANTPHAFIHPVENRAVGERARLDKATGLPKILFGSGNGYTDCTIFFESLAAADAALVELQKDPDNARYKNMKVVKNKPSNNGYFKVNTALGEVLIKAVKLNETLEEAADSSTSEADRIQDIDVYSQWALASIS